MAKKTNWRSLLIQGCTLHANGRVTVSGITKIRKASHVEYLLGGGFFLFGENYQAIPLPSKSVADMLSDALK